ncbi:MULTISPECIES: hypothetical protein [Reichenbachiella]|uniref:Lipoprotein n=1 Tax=Reichenbachiella agariperforans TaxID=156994 RepID=A0A1M6VFI8_REIAG|nr:MULTISPECIES: hypothetical protein [Reichenbachiella]MBU2914884.1 hypothetical protein [Reichenbachiella agariperforans]RJE75261.1 hypothetical protein BGP76_19395 [Reichenbachiella sp. MSK19-1]SHK80293.1 hypothetical protein SAMN04488028_10931 [Reichenbachiella agariperforans]
MNLISKSFLSAALLASVLFVSSCDKDDDGGSSTWTDAQIAELREESCEGTSDDACDCYVDKITEEYSYKEYSNLGFDDLEKLIEISTSCAG